jgi:hypothetical protein
MKFQHLRVRGEWFKLSDDDVLTLTILDDEQIGKI